MSTEDMLVIVRRNDFLARLTDEDYEALNIVHNFITAPKNNYIYFDAQNFDKLYFIKEGHVKIGNIDNEGNEIVKEILSPGDVFGQFALQRNNMQGEYAQAYKKTVSLCSFTVNDFTQLLTQKPNLIFHFTGKIAQKLEKVNYRLINLLQKDVRTRVLYFLWSLMQERKSQPSNTFSIENYFTHEDIARLTGTSRQTVTTLINRFVDEGLIEMNKEVIIIKDINRLQKEARVG